MYYKKLDDLREGERVVRMQYSRYKKHYADCYAIYGSYYKEEFGATIDIVIPEGRMVASGTRGMNYGYFWFRNDEGDWQQIKAVDLEHAEKRMRGTTYKYMGDKIRERTLSAR